jgi:hypothetical protein
MKGNDFMFTNIKEKKPKEEGLYVCRILNDDGSIDYRIDEYRIPTVFEEKYEGIVEGFQKDFGSLLKTEGYMKISDDYEKHIIKFDKNGVSSIFIKGEEFNLQLGNCKLINGDTNPKIYEYPLIGYYGDTTINSYIDIYCFNDKTNKVVVPESEFTKIIEESGDETLKEYMNKYFSINILDLFNNR